MKKQGRCNGVHRHGDAPCAYAIHQSHPEAGLLRPLQDTRLRPLRCDALEHAEPRRIDPKSL